MGLFGDNAERAARDAAANTEVQRLTALPAADMAERLLPAFGSGGAKAKGRQGTPPMQIIRWLVADYPGADMRPLVPAVLAGLEALETAGLVSRTTAGTGTGSMCFTLTALGAQRLAG